jgi:PAS domain S-box-containing protein
VEEEKILLDAIAKRLGRVVERLRAQDALQRAYRSLEDKVKQRTWDLQQSEERLQMAVEGADLGLWDWDVRADRTTYNQRWLESLGYSMQELEPEGDSWARLLHPDDRAQALAALEASLENAPALFENEHRLCTKAGEWIWVLARGRVVEWDASGRPVRHAGTFLDITQRKEAEEALRRRTQDLAALHHASQRFFGELSVQTTLDQACRQAVEAFGCKMAWVGLIDAHAMDREAPGKRHRQPSWEVVPASSFGSRDEYLPTIRVTWDEGMTGRGPTGTAIRTRQAVAMNHIDREPAFAPWREAALARGYRSSAAFPLIHGDLVLGALNVYSAEPDHFDAPRMMVLQSYANLVAAALVEARLFEQVQRDTQEMEQRVADRTRELAVLYEVASLSGRSLDLETILARSLAHVLETLGYEKGLIHFLDDDAPSSAGGGASSSEASLRLVVQQGFPNALAAQADALLVQRGLGAWVVEHRQPHIVPDITLSPDTMLSPGIPLAGSLEPRAYLGIPLQVGGRVLGVLSIFGPVDRLPFSVEELSLLTSVGDQLGTVIESARLRAEAERRAVSEARMRLARDLHDSVTQLLYTVSLFAATGQQALAGHDRRLLKHALDQLEVASQQALREMRLLLYELQLPRLVQLGLIEALRHRLRVVEERVGVEVHLVAGQLLEWPVQVEQELYYIALEALNNALKHAAATAVTIHVDAQEGQVRLQVSDNGAGFDPDAAESHGGLGLASMRERATRLGGTLEIMSAPGAGTRVVVTVPCGV